MTHDQHDDKVECHDICDILLHPPSVSKLFSSRPGTAGAHVSSIQEAKAWQRPTSQARVRKARYASPSAPPMTSTISLHSFMGGGKGFGSRPSH